MKGVCVKSNFLLFSLLLISLSSCNETSNPSSPVKKSTNPVASDDQSSNTPTPSPVPTPTPIITPTPQPPIVNPLVGDPLFNQQWHIKNTAQTGYSDNGGTAGADINLINYNSYTGAGVLVAISDNGVEVNHEDLRANAVGSLHRDYNKSSPYLGDPTPDSGGSAHGTAVTGIVQARANNGLGGRGIAPNAQFAGFKFVGAPLTTAKYIDQANGIFDIYNYSYGDYSCSFSGVPSSLISQLEYGVITLRSGKGAIYVKASGNEYYSPLSDCYSNLQNNPYYLGNAALEEDHSYPFYVLVGALNAKGKSAFYSTPGSPLWVSAPGGEFGTTSPAVVTTDLSGCNEGNSQSSANENNFEKGSSENSNCNYTSTMNGTSAASPMVTGVVALMLAENPNLSWRDVKYILASTADPVDINMGNTSHPTGNNLSGHTYLQGWITNAAGFKFHNWYGFGSVNAESAITMAKNYTSNWSNFSKNTYSSANNLNLSIPDDISVGVQNTINVSSNKKIEAVQIEVDITHTYVGDLGIELTSPSGTKSQLMLINSGVIQEDINKSVLLSNAFYMENAMGTWTLKIIDGANQDTGTLNNWKINIYGH